MHRRTAPRPPGWWTIGLAVLAALAAGPALAQPLGPISPAIYHAPSGYRTKEFTLVRDRGVFHLFYIRESTLPGAPTEQSLGHATSRDLYTWTEQDTILPVLPGTFEGTQIWAPHLLKVGDAWRMFYTVMRDDPPLGYHLAQAITSASSTDLVHWTRRDQPLFDNAIFPWAEYDTTVSQGRDCRDPFVWWDETRAEWLMYVATRPASDPTSMVIGIAASTDLEHWEDRGFVPITQSSVAFSDVAESPTVFQGDPSQLFFLWTTDSGNALTYGLSDDAINDWGSAARLKSMLGYSTLGWWGSESLVDGARRYFASIDDSWIQFWDLHWTSPATFALQAPNPVQILDAGFDRHVAVVGDTLSVFGRVVHGAGRTLGLRYVRQSDAAPDTIVGADYGLPDSLVLNADSSAASFVVPATLGRGIACLLMVTAADGVAAPDTLHVVLPTPPDTDPPLDPELPPQRVRLMVLGRSALVRFVRDRADGDWDGAVFDVRGRRLWQGHAGPGERTLVWRAGGAAGLGETSAARVSPGIYFARLREAGRPVLTMKVPRLPVGP